MLNMIIGFSILTVWIVNFATMINTLKPKKNIILGVTLPSSAHEDPETKKICNSFRKLYTVVMILLLLLIIPAFFMQLMGYIMIWFMTWLLLFLTASAVIFAIHRGKLMALKREKNWYSAAAGRALVDIKAAATHQKKINGLWFLPPVIISLIPAIYSIFIQNEFGMLLLYVTFTVMAVLFWLLYYLIFRLRAEVVNENATLTMTLTRVRRYNWGKMCLISSWLTGALNLSMWVFIDNMSALLFAPLVYCLIMIVLAMYTEFATRIAQQKLTAANTTDFYLDEDEYWLLGLVYHNPNDNHLMVNDRIGMNMSVNLAKPAGKLIIALSVLIIMALPFFGIWTLKEEVTPANLVLSETSLTARHTKDQYVIKLDDIESIELVETLPSMIRVAGIGLENLSKGLFRAGDYGTSRICINPKEPPFLLIKSGGNTYIIHDADSNVTREVYQFLRR